MSANGDGLRWLDQSLVRPYAVTDGRTRPTHELDLVALVTVTGRPAPAALRPEHAQTLALCTAPTSVAEIAARLGAPVLVAKILLSDLLDCGALIRRNQPRGTATADEQHVLERLLDGLQRL